MEHAKKMILVPSETVARFNQSPITSDPLIELNQELSRILGSHGVSDSEKWAKYHQVLERCLKHVEQRRKPMAFAIDEGDGERGATPPPLGPPAPPPPPPPSALQRQIRGVQQMLRPRHEREGVQIHEEAHSSRTHEHVIDDILSTIPKTYRAKGSVLLDRLGKSGSIDWDASGTVKIDNKTIDGSNIIDLVNDSLRFRKNVRMPIGYKEFYKTLAKLNVPQELIGNDERWTLIRNFVLDGKGPNSPHFDTLWPKTPEKPKKRSKSTESLKLGATKRRLDWERFKF